MKLKRINWIVIFCLFFLGVVLGCGGGGGGGSSSSGGSSTTLDYDDSPFGIALGHEGFYEKFTNGDVPIIREAGATHFGIHIHWSDIEPTSDDYDWRVIDTYLGEINDGDNAYIVVFTDGFCTEGLEVRGALLKPECEDDYREFISDLVKKADGKIKYWQREIEPGLGTNWPISNYVEYVEVQQMFYEEVKRADPDALVGALGISGVDFLDKPDEKYFVEYFFNNADNWYDYLDVHLYRDKYRIPDGIKELKSMMKSEKKLIIKESGGPTAFEYEDEFYSTIELAKELGDCTTSECVNDWAFDNYNLIDEKIQIFVGDATSIQDEKRDRIQCRDMNQRFLMAFAEGAETVFHWDLLTPLAGKFHAVFGSLALIDEVKQKRSNFYCYQRMTEKLEGILSVQKISHSNQSIYLYKIIKPTETMYVVWRHIDGKDSYDEDTLTKESITLNDFDLKGDVTVTDVFGNTYTKSVANGNVDLDVDNTPLYIEVK